MTDWTRLEQGANPDYTPASIAGYGVPADVAAALYDQLGGASAGNDTSPCRASAFLADTGVSTETADCVGEWGIGVPPDCGDQCEHVEVFRFVGGRWQSRGGFPSFCVAGLTQSGMPAETARQLIPDVCGDDGGDGASTSRTLRQGDGGGEVRALQAALVAKGYAIEVDGEFGPGIEAAVFAYQQSAGLAPDGIAGPATLRALGLVP